MKVKVSVRPSQDGTKARSTPIVKCTICGKPNPNDKCWHNPDNKKVVSSAEFNSQYMGDNSNWGQDNVVKLTNMEIIMIILMPKITRPTIRSFFVRLI